MEVELAVHLAPFIGPDQLLVAEAHGMQVTIQIGPPEIIVGKLREKPDFAYG